MKDLSATEVKDCVTRSPFLHPTPASPAHPLRTHSAPLPPIPCILPYPLAVHIPPFLLFRAIAFSFLVLVCSVSSLLFLYYVLTALSPPRATLISTYPA